MLLLFLLVAIFLGTSAQTETELKSDLYDEATSRVVFNARNEGSYWTLMGGEYIHGDQPQSYMGNDMASELSADGLTVVYGSSGDGALGGLRVREYDGESWVMKGAALYGPSDDSAFGRVNSISGDGDTIATGSSDFNSDGGPAEGKVWVYTWDGSAWQPKGTIEAEEVGIGSAVIMSNDGNSVFVGFGDGAASTAAMYDWDGADWVMRGDWMKNGDSSSCGYTVSMARETTNTVLMYCDGDEEAVVFMWNGTDWVLSELFDGPHGYLGEVEDDDYWGQQSAISDDGMYVMMGGQYMHNPVEVNEGKEEHGGFQVLKWTGSNWIPYGDIVFGGSDVAYATVYGAAMSRDGQTVCMTEEAPHYLVTCHTYDASKGDWVPKGMPLTVTPEPQRLATYAFGYGMSLNTDGSILMFGSPNYDLDGPDVNDDRGAVMIFQWHESFLHTQGATKRVLALQEILGSGVTEFKWNKIQMSVGRIIFIHSQNENQADAVTAFSAWYDITKTAYTMDNFNNLKTAVDTFVSDHGIAIVDPAATVWMYDDYRRRKM